MSYKVEPIVNFDEMDLEHVKKLCRTSYSGLSYEDVLQDIARGILRPWRITGPKCEGILLLRLDQHPLGRELVIWGIAGSGIMRGAKDMFGTIVGHAREQGCRWVTAYNMEPHLAKLYSTELFNLPPVGTIHRMELSDVYH
jgi:hypothetical protein